MSCKDNSENELCRDRIQEVLTFDDSGTMKLTLFGSDIICDVRTINGGGGTDPKAFVFKVFDGNEI